MQLRHFTGLGIASLFAGLMLLAAYPLRAQAAKRLDTATIERLTCAKGQMFEKEGVFKVMLARNDLKVVVAGTPLAAPQGLACWAAFQKAGDGCMVMGDMCLEADQVNPVMSAALDSGLDVTALHNHFLWESPRVMYMHVSGLGNEETLAAAIAKVFAAVRVTMGGHGPVPAAVAATNDPPDGAKITKVLGVEGARAGNAWKVVVGKTTKMMGAECGNAMGVNTWAAFAGTDELAVVDGDFVMTESELQPVLRALRAAGVNVVAIHNHMTMEQPRMMFLHFWGVGPAESLARGLRSALDAQAAATGVKM